MLTFKTYHRKTKRGNVLKIVREHYLRDDIHCGIAECRHCLKPDLSDGFNEKFHFISLKSITTSSKIVSQSIHVPHVIIPDVDVVLDQTDVLVENVFKNVIICQTVLDEVRRRSPPAYKKILDELGNAERCFFYFANEFHRDTYAERKIGESADERNERAFFMVVQWYTDHLKDFGDYVPVLLCSTASKQAAAISAGFKYARTLKEYVESMHPPQPEILDKLTRLDTSDNLNLSGGKGKVLFAEHKQLPELQTGIKSGRYKQGTIQISRENFLEGNVFVEGQEEPVFVQGLLNLNRAVHGDLVAIEMLPKEEWTAPAALLKTIDMENDEEQVPTESDDIDQTEDLEIVKAVPRSKLIEKLPTGRVVGILKRNWRPYCGILLQNSIGGSTRHIFVPAEKRVPRIRIETRQAKILVGQRIIVCIDSWPRNSRYPLGHYVRSLGQLGDRMTENEVLLLEHDVPHHSFSQAILDCLPKMPWLITAKDEKAREDLRHLDICSVDPPGCTDIDDALHCMRLKNGRYEVGVHIADVSHFVRPGTAMDAEAANRGTTVYLVDRRIDMLPDLLSSNLCSLRGGEERFAFSVIWELTEDGEIIDVRYCKSIIRSRAALTYAEAQMRIDDKTMNDPITLSLRLLNQLAKELKKKRRAAGALTLASMEIRFRIDSETHDPIDVQAKQLLDTNSMVEEFMLLANIWVAKKILQEFADCAILRRHPVPPPSNYKPIMEAAARRGLKINADSGKSLAESLDKAVVECNPYFNTMLRILCTRCMTQAYFASGTLEPSSYLHFGLATPIYTHFTSPIRRFADILVHRLLAAAINSDVTYADLLSKKKSQEICNNLNYRHKMAQYAGRASVLLNTHLFFKNKVEQLEGYVLQVRKNALQVLIPKYGLESAVFLPKFGSPFVFNDEDCTLSAGDVRLRMFDKVTVKLSVDDSDVQHQKLKLELIEPKVLGFSVEPILSAPDSLMEPPLKKQKIE